MKFRMATALMGNTEYTDSNWLHSFPELENITDPSWNAVVRSARAVQFPEGGAVFVEHETCNNFMLVATGSIRVQKTSENGGIITLYHLAAGQTCELTTACLLAGQPYPAEAVSETEATVALVPGEQFREALIQSPHFRTFVFSTLGKGMNELVTLIEEVAFGQMDGRLARCLLSKSQLDTRIESTHQKLAEELGSAREVISRTLKKFEHQDWVHLHRGWIEIINRKVLQDLSKHIDR